MRAEILTIGDEILIPSLWPSVTSMYIFFLKNSTSRERRATERELLREHKKKIALGESCTGGYISSLFTGIPGSLEIFNGAAVPYNNQIKHELLQIDSSIFEQHGAVCKKCVLQMAEQVKIKFHSDYSIATSDIVDPAGGTPEKLVGTVWIAVSSPEKTLAMKFIFGDDGQRNINLAAATALNMLRKMIVKGD